MAQGQSGSSPYRLIRLTPEAEDDRLLVYLETEQQWGARQANNYDDFLLGIMQEIAAYPRSGSIVENVAGMRRYFARWRNARNGHHIFYEETSEGILVHRILHSAMDWRDRLVDE